MNNYIISVKEVEYHTPTTYILRMEKKNLNFQAGQYTSLGLPGDTEKREYSVYSGENEAYGQKDYHDDRYILCASKDPGGTFHGRVIDYIRANQVNKDSWIHEIPPRHIGLPDE